MKKLMMILLISLISMSFQEKAKEVTIQTSAECDMCKERIEEKLNYTKGIVFSELDVPSKMLTVKYKESKISLQEIKMILSEMGYDADDVKANPTAVEKLPKCCQPGAAEHQKNH